MTECGDSIERMMGELDERASIKSEESEIHSDGGMDEGHDV